MSQICGWFALEGPGSPHVERRGLSVFQDVSESSRNVEVWMVLAGKAPFTCICASVVPYFSGVWITGGYVWFGKRTYDEMQWFEFLLLRFIYQGKSLRSSRALCIGHAPPHPVGA